VKSTIGTPKPEPNSQITLELPSFTEVLALLHSINGKLARSDSLIVPQQAWFSLTAAARLKGVPYGTLTGRAWLKPNQGKPDGLQGNKKMWRRDTIIRWLNETDAELPPPATIPERTRASRPRSRNAGAEDKGHSSLKS
jgi:hypothetical protein